MNRFQTVLLWFNSRRCIKADHDIAQEDIRFRVCNRATDKFYLNKISSLVSWCRLNR
jgi:hypothetical protein